MKNEQTYKRVDIVARWLANKTKNRKKNPNNNYQVCWGYGRYCNQKV